MNSGQWQRLNEIFAAAIELDRDRQSQFLREVCAGDESLQLEAEAILAATQHADRQGFLKGDVFADGAQVLAANEIPPGTIIGPYRVVEEIGRGGMGAVYLATREGFQQTVALKIIKRGMDTESIVRRFVMERDVLASLNHPNIARLLDGGTTKGLPFIAMEYVEGDSITVFCDQRRLTIDERLVLFRKVCAALIYAHQNLVVHRDLKPSNILVTPDGEPKLLDFGIAKVLSPGQFGYTIEPTAAGAGLMTPEYASPEQIRGEKVTTASDIYSLGVLLYEMLSGHRPFRFNSRSAGEVLQVISERQPLSPSTAASTQRELVPPDHDATRQILTPDTVAERRSEKPARLKRKLAGDLDNIVLMALRKEPERRYQSVQQFVDDVRRHLEGLPVVARRATLSYRAAKFVDRNRMVSLFASLALVAILAGLSIAIWQAVVARRQWERAERRSTEVRRLANTLLKDLQDEVGGLPGSDRAREKLYEVSIEYLNGLARETNDPSVLKQLSEAYVLLGKQYGYENRKPEEIRACILQGLEISRRLAADYPNDLEVKKLLASNLVEYDFFCEKEPAAKLELNQERARLWEELAKARPSDGETCKELAGAYYTLNYLLSLYERPNEAGGYRRLLLQAREREVQLLDKTQATNLERDLLAGAYIDLGSTYAEESEDLQTGEDYFKRALTVAESLVAEHPDYRVGWVRLAAANREIAEVRYKQGDYQGALDHFRAGLEVLKEATVKLTDGQMMGAEPDYMLRIAKCLYLAGHIDEGLQMLRDAAALNSQLSEFGSTEAATATRNARFFLESGKVYAAVGLKEKALDSYRQAEDLWKKIPGLKPQEQNEADSQIGRLHLLRGDVYAASRDGRATANHEYQAAVDMLSKLKAENEIALGGLRELHEAQQKLQASAS
jgi:serine/threonine protein kinase